MIAPWLQPQNFIGAMSAGANAGLSARRADQESIEAGDRLRLAYDQLAASERRAQEEAAARTQLAHASLALRSQQLNATAAYHQGQMEAKQAADAFHRDNMTRLASQFAEREQRMKDQFTTTANEKDDREQRLADQFSQRLEEAKAREKRLGRQFDERMSANPGRLDPASAALLGADASDLRSTQKQIGKIDEEGGPSRSFFGLGAGNTGKYKALKAREADLVSKIQSYKPAKASLPRGGEPGAAQYVFDPKSGTIKAISDDE